MKIYRRVKDLVKVSVLIKRRTSVPTTVAVLKEARTGHCSAPTVV